MARPNVPIILNAVLILLSHPWSRGAAWAKPIADGNLRNTSAEATSTTPSHDFRSTKTSRPWDNIPAFHEFSNGTQNRPDLSRDDKHVFILNEENIERSAVHAWYGSWTMIAQYQSGWDSHGETWSFLNDLHSNLNFYCNIGVSGCFNQPSVENILRKWPGDENRALAQRIYPVFEMIQIDHGEKKLALEVCRDAWMFLSDHAHHIVRLVTKQVDPSRKMACEIVHKAIDFGIQLAASMAASGANALVSVVSVQNSLMSTLLKLNLIDPGQTSKMPIQALDWIMPVVDTSISSAADLTKDYLKQAGKVTEPKNATHPLDEDQKHINPGMGRDPICSEFDGDIENINEDNSHVLTQIMSSWFSKRIEEERNIYEKMYNGSIFEPGAPSARALYFGAREWAPFYGPSSRKSPLAQSAKFDADVKLRLLKHFLGRVMSDDNSYIVCMHIDDAQKQCSTTPAKADNDHIKMYRKTMFCPRPDMPKLLCQAARWRHTTGFASHITEIPGIHEIHTWNIGGRRLKIEDLLREAFRAYEMNGNSRELANWSGQDPKAPAFRLPVCINQKKEELRLHNLNPKAFPSKSHLEFPYKCGDWRANESIGFMKAMNLDPESRIYRELDGTPGTQHPNGLFWNRIPQLVEDRIGKSPISHYLTLCGNSVRLPEITDSKEGPNPDFLVEKPHAGKDKDCNFIQQKASDANLTESEANTWFCENQGNHTVFERQRKYWFMPQTFLSGSVHKTTCNDWLKEERRVKDKEEKKNKDAEKKLKDEESKKKKDEEKKRKDEEKKRKDEEKKKKQEEEKREKEKKEMEEKMQRGRVKVMKEYEEENP